MWQCPSSGEGEVSVAVSFLRGGRQCPPSGEGEVSGECGRGGRGECARGGRGEW